MLCQVGCLLLVAVSDPIPDPGQEQGAAELGRYAVSARLRCSMQQGHPGDEHQAYYGDKLFTWVFPEQDHYREYANLLGLGNTERAEGS